MRHLHLFEDFLDKAYRALRREKGLTPEQVAWLDKCTSLPSHEASMWSVNRRTGLVDVKGAFDCSAQNLTDFKGVRFGRVEGNFRCCINKLTSLEGAPQRVSGGFDCTHNFLTSLEGAPQEVIGIFRCSFNPLTSLKGAPQEVGGDFYCDAGKIQDWSLKGWLKILESGGEGARLILPILPESEIDKWMKKNPLDLDLLDGHPEIKKGVLARTGLRDISSIARNMRRGTI